MDVLIEALRYLIPDRPELRLVIAGSGEEAQLLKDAGPELAPHLTLLGRVSEEDKARLLKSVDVYCAPNLGGESFGIILTEAMSAGAPIVASDLDAFRQVLGDGTAGLLVAVGDPFALADGIAELLDDPLRRTALAGRARTAVADYDWQVVARTVVKVYETVIAADPRSVAEAQ
jgi:phosphatidylinositol alpha-mannosyltransferase